MIQQLRGNRAVGQMLAVQRDAEARGLREPSDEEIHSAAAEGIRTPATTLPYLDRIQASFGHHSIGHVKAHVGPEAAKASRAMNALAFASGDHVVFGGTPDLRTAAHEAAHVIQQQAGVQLACGIGREGDAYERHADAVANAVVAGLPSEKLLEPPAECIPSEKSVQSMKFGKSSRFQNNFTTKTDLTGLMLSGESSEKSMSAKERLDLLQKHSWKGLKKIKAGEIWTNATHSGEARGAGQTGNVGEATWLSRGDINAQLAYGGATSGKVHDYQVTNDLRVVVLTHSDQVIPPDDQDWVRLFPNIGGAWTDHRNGREELVVFKKSNLHLLQTRDL